jgi:hypothetical protein
MKDDWRPVFVARSVMAIDILLEPDATMLAHRPTGVAGICAKPTPEVLKLQADIIDAAKP